jgi:hypothetical protein
MAPFFCFLGAAKQPNQTPYEQYVNQSLLAAAYLKKRDFEATAKALDAVIESGSDRVSANDLKSAIQAHYGVKNYARVPIIASRYEHEHGYDVKVQTLAAQSHYLQKNFAEAALILKKISDKSEHASQAPEESTLKLWMSAEYESRNDRGVEAALRTLVRYYPTDQAEKDLENLQKRLGIDR